MIRGVFEKDIHTVEERTFKKSLDTFIKKVQKSREVMVNKQDLGVDERFDQVNGGFGRKESTSISTSRTALADDF